MIRLLWALQRLPAAGLLPSRTGRKSLFADLLWFASRVASSEIGLESVILLLQEIWEHTTDQKIWDAAIALVTPKTPPIIANNLPFDTPFKSNSSLRASEQIRAIIDERIQQEINGCVYKYTESFYEKYFEGKKWSAKAERIADGRWTEYPRSPTQDAVLEWLGKFQQKFFRGERGKYYTSKDHPLGGVDCIRKPDLFLALPRSGKDNTEYGWPDVRVIGELKQSEQSERFMVTLVKFSGHAREVFASQPTRRFLHGFWIRGSRVQLWVFDRSGLYGSEAFDVHKDPHRFIKVMAGYTMMSDEELGLNTSIKKDKETKYILFEGDGKTQKERLYLEDKPISYERAIVCRGTTCYRARKRNSQQWEYVVKFAWRSDKRRAEGELLKLAKERNVWGVAKLFGHQDLGTIADLREGLQFGEPMTFRSANIDLISNCNSRTLSTSSLGLKRKPLDEIFPAGRSKRSKSGTVKELGMNSLMPLNTCDNESFKNRIFSCLAISPPGRAIHEFASIKELLEACRDVVKAHRSLCYDGKILHRDISVNNIIITDAVHEGDPKGMLIDLDLAKDLEGGPSGARHRTGTMEFMAIGVLEDNPHTYRHDLESLFYVFLWVIIGHHEGAGSSLPEESLLRNWYCGSYAQIADMKRSHMDKSRFKHIIAEFPADFESFKGLAEELRNILFPIVDGARFTGTYGEPEIMYKPMIEAFDRAIAGLQSGGASLTS